ncbi:hypothetical protein ACFL3G_06880 [Planctomycetota bacterium]
MFCESLNGKCQFMRYGRYSLLVFVAILCFGNTASISPAATDNTGFKAGAAQRDVTPPVGFTITHYDRKSIGVHDPLFARALVIEDQMGSSVAIVCIDFIGAGHEACDQLRSTIRRQLGIDQTLINFSHSHSSVRLLPKRRLSDPQEPAAKWNNGVHQTILEIVAQAKAALAPVTLKVSRAPAQVGFNRRKVMSDGSVTMKVNRTGPDIPWVNVLIAENKKSHKPVAVLFEAAAHPVIVPHTSGLTSADFPGAAVARIHEKMGDNFIAMFAQGCGGNINGFPLRSSHALADKAGRELGDAVIKAIEKSVPIKANKLRLRSASTQLPSGKVPTMEIWQRWADSSKNDPNKMALLNKLKTLIERGQAPPTLRFDVYSVMIGSELCMVTMPANMFCQYELWIDDKAPFEHSMTFAFTNGCDGYFAVDKDYALGLKGGYEVNTQYLPNWGSWHTLCPEFAKHFGTPLIGTEEIIKNTVSSLWSHD